MATASLSHPSIGSVNGLDKEGIYQFLGVQYATLKDRLAESQVKTTYESPVDATSHGPSAYSPPDGYDNEMLFIQKSMPKPPAVHSDLQCLNLNITVPKSPSGNIADLASQKIPVFIWMHGGGFVVGANSWPHYDHGAIVRLSMENGNPVIGVGINYRLGFPGLLTSEELRKRGYKANNSLLDQRTAFRWVKQHIAGFGGDPGNITVIGESAGAVATTLHLYSPKKLFNRAVATGGSALLMPVFDPADAEGIYQTFISILGLDELSVDERIHKLLTLPTDEVIAKIPPSLPFLPVIDGDVIPVRPTFADVASTEDKSMPGKEWVEGLMIGHSEFDASVLGFMLAHLQPNISHTFPPSLRANLPPSLASSLLDLYPFAPSSTDPFITFLNLSTDISFLSATTSYARGFTPSHTTNTPKIFTFFFNEPNPWPGAYPNRTTHVLDVVFLFQNHNHHLSPAQQQSAREFAGDVIRFMCGKEPWEGYTRERRLGKVFGPSVEKAESKIVDGKGEGIGERGRRFLEIMREKGEGGFDEVNEAVQRFRRGG